MKTLKAALAKLQEKNGKSSLVTEIEALLGTPKETPLSHQFLALAAAEIGQGNFEFAHDCIGGAIEAHLSKTPLEITPEYKTRLAAVEVKASDNALRIPLPELDEDEKPFVEASQATVTAFADALISAGFAKEAKKYVETYNTNAKERDDMKTDKRKALLDIRDGFKKSGRLDMVRAADEMMEGLKDEGGGESKAGMMMEEAKGCPHEDVKSAMMKASYMMKAAEDMEKDGHDAAAMKGDAEEHMAKARDMLKEQSEPQEYQTSASAKPEKPVLYVEAASGKEKRLRDEASRAAGRGDVRKAKAALVQADSLERSRYIAALILAGDSEMAMEGLKEEESQNGGFPSKADGEDLEKKEGEVKDAGEHSDMPPEKVATEEPTKEPEEKPEGDKEPSEEDMAKDLEKKVESSVKRNRMRDATVAFSQLSKLEEAVVASVKLASGDKKLAAEGFKVWRDVSRSRLKAHAILAEKEGEMDEHADAMDGMEKLEDESTAHEELDKALEDMDESKATEITKDFLTPAGGKPEGGPQGGSGPAEMENKMEDVEQEEEMEEEKPETQEGEVSESMHYEVLQSLDDVKAMKVDRNALAFTFWEDDKGDSPFYVVQASGKPVAEIHLGDQDNAKEIRAYFCDEARYTKSLAQSVENTSLFDVLAGVNARFYANAVQTSALAKKMKEEAVASVSNVRIEKLADLRKDFTDAMITAAEALNKGLYDKPNALKSTFVKVLAQYGIKNPHIAVEAAFKEAGDVFFEQILDGATEYLEMPKEAFVHAKKMIRQAQNVAYAQASNFSDMTLSQRAAQNSVPFGSVPEAQEAPIVASTRTTNERARLAVQKDALKLSRKVF